MIWNLFTGGLLLYFSRKYPEKFKPGAVFALWLICAGLGRFLVEFFRPDQPRIPGTDISYSRVVAALMAAFGVVWVLVRVERIHLSFWKPARAAYRMPRRPGRKRKPR